MNKIKELRNKQGLRQIDIANKADVSLTWLWAMENGLHNRISEKIKERVANVLGVKVKELF